MYSNSIFDETNHMVDDQVLSEDETLSAFKGMFPPPVHFIDEDNKLYYKFGHEQMAKTWQRAADKMISQNGWSLTTDIQTWIASGNVTSIELCIAYKP